MTLSRGSFAITSRFISTKPSPRAQSMSETDRIPIPYEIRNRHIYIPGKTRHGKSTLIHAMAYQDIKNGAGVCVIDPKGDLVDSLLNWIPSKKKKKMRFFFSH